MKFFRADFMPNQFAILPSVGIIKRYREVYRYQYRISFIWGFWGISFGLGKPLR